MDGRWNDALAAWSTSVDSSNTDATTHRIRWLLEQGNDDRETQSEREHGLRHAALRWILYTVISGAIGTSIVLYNLDRTGREAGVFSTLAWAFYLMSMCCAVMYAYRLGRASEDAPLTSCDLLAAHEIANSLEHGNEDNPTVQTPGAQSEEITP